MNNSLLLQKLMMPELIGMDSFSALFVRQTILDAVNFSALNAVSQESVKDIIDCSSPSSKMTRDEPTTNQIESELSKFKSQVPCYEIVAKEVTREC